MYWLGTAELAAAVSNAGGLGTISPCAGMEEGADPVSNLEKQWARAVDLTDRTVAVNVTLDLPISGQLLNTAVDLGAKAVTTSTGDPRIYTGFLKARGITVFHVVSTVAQAVRAQANGVDAVIAQGIEAGGRHGVARLPLSSLLPQVKDSVTIPVVAAGGIADARGAVAAFALGAEGVQLGTRFIASTECIAHPAYKRAILEAGDQGTAVTGAGPVSTRNLRVGLVERFLTLERSGASPEELDDLRRSGRSRAAQLDGDLEGGEAHCGASAGLIREVLPAGDIVERLVRNLPGVIDTLLLEPFWKGSRADLEPDSGPA